MARFAIQWAVVALAGASAALAAPHLDAPGHAAQEGVAVRLLEAAAGSTWSLATEQGACVASGLTAGADGQLALPSLPAGYYRLSGGKDELTLAVVRAPPPDGAHGGFYAVDSAQSWLARPGEFLCPWNDGETGKTVSDLIGLVGFRHVRDRLSWRGAEPVRGRWNFTEGLASADTLAARGIKTTGMFHDAPAWAARREKLPGDLAATWEFCRTAAATFGDRMEAWEFWNEPDIHFAPEPVWEYAAALKAGVLGFKAAGRADVAVLAGALCREPDSPYLAALLANDAAKFTDAFNFHIYAPLATYPETFARLRSNLARAVGGSPAIWVTESATRSTGPSRNDGVLPGKKAASRDQERVAAEFYPKAQIALQMAGVSRNYHFVFCPYNDPTGQIDWGVMRRDGTVKPVYAAMAAMTSLLGAARLEGEVRVGEGRKAYLFRLPDGTQTLVCWAVSPLETAKAWQVVSAHPDCARNLSLAAPDGRYPAFDIFEHSFAAVAERGRLRLAATRDPVYVTGLHGLKADVPPVASGPVRSYRPTPDEDLSVIVCARFDPRDFAIDTLKTRAVLTGERGRVRVEIWNMDETVKTGRIEVVGARLADLPSSSFEVGPRGAPPCVFDCLLTPCDDGAITNRLELTGLFGGRRSSRFAAPLMFERRAFDACRADEIDWRRPDAWTCGTSADKWSVAWDEQERALRFEAVWNDPATDRWFYPAYALKRPQENMGDVQLVSFEVKAAQDDTENAFVCQYVALGFADAGAAPCRFAYPAPLEKWERRFVELGADDRLGAATRLKIGANPRGRRLTFWLRNVSIHRPTAPSGTHDRLARRPSEQAGVAPLLR